MRTTLTILALAAARGVSCVGTRDGLGETRYKARTRDEGWTTRGRQQEIHLPSKRSASILLGARKLEMFIRSLQGLQQQPRMVSECMNGMTWGSQ